MRAAFGRHQCVDLVDDDRVDRTERVAGVRGQQQVERFGRRDQDVGRVAHEAGAFLLRRVAGPDRDLRSVERVPSCRGAVGDPSQRGPQVPLDIHCQRLQRRDVDHPAPPLLLRKRIEHHPVDAPQEGGQRLSAAGRRQDEGRLSPGNRRPPGTLGRGGRFERVAKPLGDGGLEQFEHAAPVHHVTILSSPPYSSGRSATQLHHDHFRSTFFQRATTINYG